MVANRLTELLAVPAKWLDRPSQWEKLTTGGLLFSRLLDPTLHMPEGWEAVERLIAEWEQKYPDESPWGSSTREGMLAQISIVRRLLWCAQQAATRRDFYLKQEVDQVCFAEDHPPEFVFQDRTTSWGWIQTFLGARVRGRVSVPVALLVLRKRSDETTTWEGTVANLELEVIEAGAGEVFLHCRDAFRRAAGGNLPASRLGWFYLNVILGYRLGPFQARLVWLHFLLG